MISKDTQIPKDRCKHEFKLTRDNYGICSLCKEEREYHDGGQKYDVIRPGIPPWPETKNKTVRHRYLEENKTLILKDLQDIGWAATLKRWEMIPSTLSVLKKRWGAEVTAAAHKLDTSGATGTRMEPIKISPHVAVELPTLPEFDYNWPLAQKLIWLAIYHEMVPTKKTDIEVPNV